MTSLADKARALTEGITKPVVWVDDKMFHDIFRWLHQGTAEDWYWLGSTPGDSYRVNTPLGVSEIRNKADLRRYRTYRRPTP